VTSGSPWGGSASWLVPLEELLIIHVENASAPDAPLQVRRAEDDEDWSTELVPRGSGLYVLERGDSNAQHCIIHEPMTVRSRQSCVRRTSRSDPSRGSGSPDVERQERPERGQGVERNQGGRP
jgi:hypothetical protein